MDQNLGILIRAVILTSQSSLISHLPNILFVHPHIHLPSPITYQNAIFQGLTHVLQPFLARLGLRTKFIKIHSASLPPSLLFPFLFFFCSIFISSLSPHSTLSSPHCHFHTLHYECFPEFIDISIIK